MGDIDGLTRALEGFGMIIDTSAKLKQRVFKVFASNGEKSKGRSVRWIDYDDFVSTLSCIVASQETEVLRVLFAMFDVDGDGFLEIADVARILLTQNQIAVVVTNRREK